MNKMFAQADNEESVDMDDDAKDPKTLEEADIDEEADEEPDEDIDEDDDLDDDDDDEDESAIEDIN